MRRLHAAMMLVALLLTSCAGERRETADLVVLDGAVATMDPAMPEARALAVRDGRIVAVGDVTSVRGWIGPDTEVIEAQGRSVLPGLVDSHIHALVGALSQAYCSLGDEELDVAQAAEPIRACAVRQPDVEWVVIREVNGANFRADRQALDAIISDRPLFLWGADGHTGWVNTRGLERAVIGKGTKDPDDGRIERDATGAPTGFLADGAVDLITDIAIRPDAATRDRALREVLPELHAAGITGYMEANTDADGVAAYIALAAAGGLNARVTLALASSGEVSDAEFSRLKGLRAEAEKQPGLRADVIKLFADGVMEYPTQSAAMLSPYLDAGGQPTANSGRLYIDAAQMRDFIARADREGFSVHVHAIGDRAARTALDAIEAARAAGSQRRYSMAHLQLVDAADLPRFAALDVIASLQLLWAQPDNYSVDAVQAHLGADRHARLYPAAALRDRGAVIAGGSDWDVTSFNPFEAMAVALSRSNPAAPERGTLGADQSLPLAAMLAAYTTNAARVLGRDAEIGSLGVGKAADLIVLDRYLDDAASADEIAATRVLVTVHAGKVVHRVP